MSSRDKNNNTKTNKQCIDSCLTQTQSVYQRDLHTLSKSLFYKQDHLFRGWMNVVRDYQKFPAEIATEVADCAVMRSIRANLLDANPECEPP